MRNLPLADEVETPIYSVPVSYRHADSDLDYLCTSLFLSDSFFQLRLLPYDGGDDKVLAVTPVSKSDEVLEKYAIWLTFIAKLPDYLWYLYGDLDTSNITLTRPSDEVDLVLNSFYEASFDDFVEYVYRTNYWWDAIYNEEVEIHEFPEGFEFVKSASFYDRFTLGNYPEGFSILNASSREFFSYTSSGILIPSS